VTFKKHKTSTGASGQLEVISSQKLDLLLRERIYEQPDAVEAVVRAHSRIEMNLISKEKPMSSLMFLGPTGSGKTELAKLWAQSLNIPFFRFDCSAYSEPHTVSSFVGAPPGYVGSNRVSQLYEKLHSEKNFVILLDEIEKAHPDVVKLFLSVLDSGVVNDRGGREIDFRGAIIIMTTNAASVVPNDIGIGIARDQEEDSSAEAATRSRLLAALRGYFPREFLGRINQIVHFNSLSGDGLEQVVHKKVAEINRLPGFYERGLTLELQKGGVDKILEAAATEDLGARPVSHKIDHEIVSEVAAALSDGRIKDDPDYYTLISFDYQQGGWILETQRDPSRSRLPDGPSEEESHAPDNSASDEDFGDARAQEGPAAVEGEESEFLDDELLDSDDTSTVAMMLQSGLHLEGLSLKKKARRSKFRNRLVKLLSRDLYNVPAGDRFLGTYQIATRGGTLFVERMPQHRKVSFMVGSVCASLIESSPSTSEHTEYLLKVHLLSPQDVARAADFQMESPENFISIPHLLQRLDPFLVASNRIGPMDGMDEDSDRVIRLLMGILLEADRRVVALQMRGAV
jgi:MoxR-like ATPase